MRRLQFEMFSYLYPDLLDLTKVYGFFGMSIYILSLLVKNEIKKENINQKRKISLKECRGI
jgi:hypothetical protein